MFRTMYICFFCSFVRIPYVENLPSWYSICAPDTGFVSWGFVAGSICACLGPTKFFNDFAHRAPGKMGPQTSPFTLIRLEKFRNRNCLERVRGILTGVCGWDLWKLKEPKDCTKEISKRFGSSKTHYKTDVINELHHHVLQAIGNMYGCVGEF